MSAKNDLKFILKKLEDHVYGCQQCTESSKTDNRKPSCDLGNRLSIYYHNCVDLSEGLEPGQSEFTAMFRYWPSNN